MANKLHVKKDDTVVVISGDDKGKKGKVLSVSPEEGKVIVEGVNIVTKHAKPRRQGEAGGIIKQEALPESLRFGEGKAFEPIVWDGNTEGLESVQVAESGMTITFYKVFDTYTQITSAQDIVGVTVEKLVNGEMIEESTSADYLGVNMLEHGWVMGLHVVSSDGQLNLGVSFSEGTWLSDRLFVSENPVHKATITPAVTTIPMNEKYLPVLTSPGGKKFKLSVADDGTITATEVTA